MKKRGTLSFPVICTGKRKAPGGGGVDSTVHPRRRPEERSGRTQTPEIEGVSASPAAASRDWRGVDEFVLRQKKRMLCDRGNERRIRGASKAAGGRLRLPAR